ncbi:MAG: insulinase family protein [Hahellaceae bacterium]|nr:insulinase family protein [Hahellaceae bacterium]
MKLSLNICHYGNSGFVARNKSFLYKALLTSVLILCGGMFAHASSFVIPEKSPSDPKAYRVIQLSNQLQVMLISDPETDKAAAALDIAVGSGADPEGYEGLAHFLEHMLFLGTTKYPEAGAYQAFIQQHGGNHNAFTAFDHTNYFFDVEASSLEPALDRFSAQFVAPLFTEAYVEREKNAVHSEYSAKIKDDSRRYFSVFKESLNRQHPYSRFSVGNLDTLSSRNGTSIRQVLIDFYNTQYSANRMKLVILGKQPLNELEQWAKTKFSRIPNHKLARLTYDMPLFNQSELPIFQQLTPVMNKRSLNLTFPVPSSRQYYESKPLYYLSNLIGHEGEGSLLSYLKAKGWVDSLSSGEGFDAGQQATFDIGLRLTPEGEAQWKNIVKAVFSYIDLLKSAPINPDYFNEQKQMLGLAFKFQEKSEPIHYVSMLATHLHDVPAKRVLNSDYLMKTFKPELIRSYLDQLNAKNVVVSLMAPEAITQQKTPWYDTDYSMEKRSPTLNALFAQTEAISEFHLPARNPFIPEQTAMVSGKDVAVPELLEHSEGFLSWYAKDTSFGTPKADIFVNFRSPVANDSARHQVLTTLMVSLLNDSLSEFSYPAYLAGLSYQLYPHVRGVSLKISGYSDKQNVLLTEILGKMKYGSISRARFDIFKDNLQRSLENSKKQKPYQQTLSKTNDLIVSPAWSDDEKLVELASVEFDELATFTNHWFDRLDVLMLQNGNINRSTALNHGAIVQQMVVENAQSVSVNRSKVTKLKEGMRGFEIKIEHPDSSLIYYLQGENKSYREQARYLLLSQIVSSPYYEQIRTEKQMGYIVFSSNYTLFDHPGIGFIVQSPGYSPAQILEATKGFIEGYAKTLADMPDSTYEQHIKALVSTLEEKENTITERTNRYWIELDRDNAAFDWKQQIVAEIKQLSKKSFIEFYRQHILQHPHELVVYNAGENLAQAENNTPAIPLISKKQELWSGVTK